MQESGLPICFTVQFGHHERTLFCRQCRGFLAAELLFRRGEPEVSAGLSAFDLCEFPKLWHFTRYTDNLGKWTITIKGNFSISLSVIIIAKPPDRNMCVHITYMKTKGIFIIEGYFLPVVQTHMRPIQTSVIGNAVSFDPKNRVHNFCPKFG